MPRARIPRIHRSGGALCIVSAILLAVPGFAIAQEAAAPATPAAGSRAIPRPDELEPGVSTSPAAAAAPAATAPPAVSATQASPAATPSADLQPAKPAPVRQNAAAAQAAPRKGPDRLELDTTDITGNRELPKVLYIVPWKRSDLGDVVGRPVNSLLDEVLQPLDRDVFRRENRYYDALKPGAGGAKAGAAQGSQTKP
jgi:hypothetical protein